MNSPHAKSNQTATARHAIVRAGGMTLAGLLLLASLAPAARAQSTEAGITITNTPEQGPSDRADDYYVAGAPVVYTIVVENPGDEELLGAAVVARLPPDIASGTWTCRAEGGARCGSDEGRGHVEDRPRLPARTRVRYVWTMPVPAGYARNHTSLDALASLTLPEGLRAADPGRLTARDSDPEAGVQRTRTEQPARPLAGRQSLMGGAVGGQGDGRSGGRGSNVPGGPFPACDATMYMSYGLHPNRPTTIARLDVSQVPFELDPIGDNSQSYNAIGFNPRDNYIYGIRLRTTNLYRIHSNGYVDSLGNISGLPSAGSRSYNSGEIGADGYMYALLEGTDTVMYRIDISNPHAAFAVAIPLVGGTVSGNDLAWINGRLYTVNRDGTVAWIDPTTGAVTTLPAVNGTLGDVGALFGTPTALYGAQNNPGGFYQFDLTTGAAIKLSDAPPVASNDGAHCATAPIELDADVSVTKTNTPDQGPSDLPNDTFRPGTNVTYRIVVSNDGPVGVAGMSVTDPVPTGITTTSWTCSIIQGDGQCGTSSGTGAIDTTVDLQYNAITRTGSQALFSLIVSVPANYLEISDTLTNTVAIELPPDYVDPTPDDHTATDTDEAERVDLRVVKQTTAGPLVVGQTIEYTLVADNPGTINVTNALLSDTPNSRLDCLTPTEPPVCTATGGAQCPAGGSLTRPALLGTGVVIPLLPAGGASVTVSLSCVVVQ